jgi:hypothetical protein
VAAPVELVEVDEVVGIRAFGPAPRGLVVNEMNVQPVDLRGSSCDTYRRSSPGAAPRTR